VTRLFMIKGFIAYDRLNICVVIQQKSESRTSMNERKFGI